MKKPLTTLCYLPFILAYIFLAGCNESQPDDVYKLLEEKAKVKTFPLTIVLTDPLSGNEFPEDLKLLCRYSAGICKTLPTAGILRLGPDQYFTYNPIALLDVTAQEGDDEATIAQSVQNQVSAYYVKTKMQGFDSLRAANKSDFNSRALTAQYVQNNKDSIYFFSARASDPSVIMAGNRIFPVYKNAAELRRIIDEQICKNSFTVSVFYAPAASSAGLVPTGMYAGDTCLDGSKFEKLNDGKGNLFVGKLVEQNSKSCGFSFPTGVAGDTCISFSKYQKLHDGKGGFKTGTLVEKNSQSCGYVAPKPQVETNLKIQSAPQPNAATPSKTAVVSAQPVKPAPVAKAQPVLNNSVGSASKSQQVRINSGGSLPATQPVRVNAPTTRSANSSTQPVRVNSASSTQPIAGNTETAATSTDKRCAKTGDPMCEQDERGNYTGRRIQYCYNNAGKVVRTIVLKKCDGDCRCLGD